MEASKRHACGLRRPGFESPPYTKGTKLADPPMPRATIRGLTEALETQNAEVRRLRERVERLQEALREQAEAIRKGNGSTGASATPPTTLPASAESHCPVCFEALTDMDPQLACGHEICQKCCQIHFAANSKCPLCRRDASPKELWRFRHPRLARFWGCLRGHHWPLFGDFVVVSTDRRTIAGNHVGTSDERQAIKVMHHFAEWDIPLETVHEILTLQHLVDGLPPREDGLLRRILNE